MNDLNMLLSCFRTKMSASLITSDAIHRVLGQFLNSSNTIEAVCMVLFRVETRMMSGFFRTVSALPLSRFRKSGSTKQIKDTGAVIYRTMQSLFL